MRKKMIYSFIVGLIFYCVMGLSQAQAATLSLGSDITASPGEKVVVPVIFMPAAGENFTDLRFVIRFDSSIVTINPLLIDVRQGPVYPTGKSWTKKLTSYGDLSVFIYGGSTLITGGTAAIVTSSFTIIATGDTNLTFVAADGSDKDGNAFDVGTSGMWIKVQRPPVLDTIADQNVNEGSALSFTLHATDPDGDTLSYSMVNPPAKVPAGALNAASGLFTWTPGYDDAGSYALTFKADDGKGLSDTKGCTITVNNLNRAPTISDIADQAILQGQSTSALAFTIGDADGNLDSLTLRGNSSNKSLVPDANILFAGSGANRTVIVTPAPGQNGNAVITVTVSDGSLAAADTFTLNVCVLGSPILAVGSGQAPAGEAVRIPINLTTPINALKINSLSFVIQFDKAKITINPLIVEGGDVSIGPAANDGATINKEIVAAYPGGDTSKIRVALFGDSGVAIKDGEILYLTFHILSGLPTGDVALSVTEYSALTASGQAITNLTLNNGLIKITVPPNRPPVLDTIADQNVNEGSALSFTLHATDPDGDTLSYSMVNPPAKVPAGALNAASGLFTWTPGYDDAGSYALTFKADDGKGLSDTKGCTITVNNLNRAPTISDIADQAILQGQSTSALAFTIGDADGNLDSLKIRGNSSNKSLVPDANILFAGSGANRTVIVTPAPGQNGNAVITVTVSDGSLAAADTFTLNVGVLGSPILAVGSGQAPPGAAVRIPINLTTPINALKINSLSFVIQIG